MRESQVKPATTRTVPEKRSGRTPILGRRRELTWAPMMIEMAMGRNDRPALSAPNPSTFCRYSERKYHMEKKAAPTRNMTVLAPVTERERNRRNGTSGVDA